MITVLSLQDEARPRCAHTIPAWHARLLVSNARRPLKRKAGLFGALKKKKGAQIGAQKDIASAHDLGCNQELKKIRLSKYAQDIEANHLEREMLQRILDPAGTPLARAIKRGASGQPSPSFPTCCCGSLSGALHHKSNT